MGARQEPICEGARVQGESVCRHPWVLWIWWRTEAQQERWVYKKNLGCYVHLRVYVHSFCQVNLSHLFFHAEYASNVATIVHMSLLDCKQHCFMFKHRLLQCTVIIPFSNGHVWLLRNILEGVVWHRHVKKCTYLVQLPNNKKNLWYHSLNWNYCKTGLTYFCKSDIYIALEEQDRCVCHVYTFLFIISFIFKTVAPNLSTLHNFTHILYTYLIKF